MRVVRAPTALLAALLGLLAYACFAHGAARQPGEAWLEIGLVALALGAGATGLLGGPVRLRAPRAALAGVALLALFAVWSGVSLGWSIAPDRTWAELNRALAYALAAGLGLAIGASAPRAVERFAAGWLGVALLVALYALGGKIVPGLHLGPLDLDHTDDVARLRAPLEYWNALALVCVMAVPVAVCLASDRERRPRLRLAALLALYVLGLTIGLTYSRGGVVGVVVVAIVLTALGGARLRGLAVLALGLGATAIPLAVAFSRLGLKANGAPLALRAHDGRIFGAVVLGCGLLLLGAGLAALRAEDRIAWTARRSRLTTRALAGAAALVALLALAGLAGSQRGVGGSVSHAWDEFTTVKQQSQFDPVRLVSTNSGNRWVWWKEAAGAWSDAPLVGHGAGSFALLHKRYRAQPLPVTQAHSVPLEALAETGIVGLLLLGGGVLALLAAALARLRATPAGPERDLGVALVAAAIAWAVHGLYDWDWNIPAVTAPPLAMLGVVAAWRGPRPVAAGALSAARAPDSAARGLAVAAATLAAAAAVASAGLPAWADGKADAAAAAAAGDTPAALEAAAAQADLAGRLDPLSVRPLFVGAAVAEGRGRLLTARALLLDAAGRQPENPEVWLRLAGLALRLADRPGFGRAATRALALDPVNPQAILLAARAVAATAPPAGSATAVGTPLPAAASP
jgi:hypothetical protein